MKIIALTGKYGVGKSTTARSIRTALVDLGQKVIVIGIADPLKEMCAHLLGVPVAYIDVNKNTMTFLGYTVRTLLEKLGEMLRLNMTDSSEPGIWARRLSETLNKYNGSCYDYVIIHDCRFDDEKDVIEKHNGKIYELQSKCRGDASTALANTNFEKWLDTIKVDCDQSSSTETILRHV